MLALFLKAGKKERKKKKMLRKTGKSWGISALKTWNFNEDAQIPLSLFTRANRADIKVFPTHRNKTGFLLNQSTFFVSSWMAVSTEPAGLRKALAACGPRVGAHQGEADLCDHPFHPAVWNFETSPEQSQRTLKASLFRGRAARAPSALFPACLRRHH